MAALHSTALEQGSRDSGSLKTWCSVCPKKGQHSRDSASAGKVYFAPTHSHTTSHPECQSI